MLGNGARLGIITYSRPHLKSEQVLNGLLERGETGLEIYALPFQPRPERDVLFQHRPDPFAAAHPAGIAQLTGLPYHEIESADAIDDPPELMLITVGALIGPRLLARSRVLNVHAGLIPAVRGLDAFKWAVHDGLPLGITLHAIDGAVDCGEHIRSRMTPVYSGDTLATLARRHYDAEVAQMIDFRAALASPTPPSELEDRPPRKRMPIAVEAVMLDRFAAYVDRYAGGRCSA